MSAQTTQQPESPKTPESRFYVSVVDGPKWWPMVGPFLSHASALACVDEASRIASNIDSRAHWMGWGTCQYADGSLIGKLNERFAAELLADSMAVAS